MLGAKYGGRWKQVEVDTSLHLSKAREVRYSEPESKQQRVIARIGGWLFSLLSHSRRTRPDQSVGTVVGNDMEKKFARPIRPRRALNYARPFYTLSNAMIA